MDKIKIGIIGVGGISHEHIQGYLSNEKVELYAFCDIDENTLKKAGEKYSITRLYTDIDEMLKLDEIDAVSVCVWNSAHAPCSIKALNAGKHVLCEKPMSICEADAIKMKEAADKNNKLLMIGFVRRHGNDCKILKDFIDTDYFGELYYSKATYMRRNGNPGGWFGDKSRSGGGPLIDLGVHVTDLVWYLLGKPKPVSVYGATFKKLLNRSHLNDKKGYVSHTSGDVVCDVEDIATALIRFENGAVLSLEASFSLNTKSDTGTVEIFGTKGGAKLYPQIEIYSEINNYMVDVNFASDTALSFDGLFKNEINHFVDCVTDNIPCIAPAEDGIMIMKILDAIYKSAETGHEVVL